MAEKQSKDDNSSNERVPMSSSEARDVNQACSSRENVTPLLSTSSFQGLGITPSPPSFLSIEQMLKAAEDVSKCEFNMTLVHEIAVNKDFQLHKDLHETGYHKTVKEILHKAFWDLLHDKLTSDPPDYSHAMTLLKEVKEGLLECLSAHHIRIKNEINSILDIELIEQQVNNKTLDILSYAQFIISTMSRICAPVRDAKIDELKQLTEIVPLYRGILETLELMKFDMANFAIMQLRPFLQQHSIEYEKKKFEEILTCLSGLTPPVDGLAFTRQWLQLVYEESLQESENENLQDMALFSKAYIKILQWEEAEKFPETLQLDQARFLALRDKLKVMILVASVLLLTYSVVGPSIQGIADFKHTLKCHLQVLMEDAPQSSPDGLKMKMETVVIQVVEDVNKCLQEHGYAMLGKEKEESLKNQIVKIAENDHSVRQLIKKRILEFLEQVLQSSSTLQIPSGLSSLKDELSGFAGQFLTLMRHNLSVFSEYYSNILIQCRRS